MKDSLIGHFAIAGAIALAACDSPAAPGELELQDIPVAGLGMVTERYTAEVAVRGDYAYTTSWSFRAAPGNTVHVWHVAGTEPMLVDTIMIANASTTGDVQVSDDGTLLVVATEGTGSIAIFDRADPASLELITQWSHAETSPGVHTVKLSRVNGRQYAFLSINPGDVGARLLIVDITDPASPAYMWSGLMGNPFVHDVFVRDGILFAALWHDGLRIYDVGGGGRGGAPHAPVVMGSVAFDTRPTMSGMQGYIHNVWWFHDPASGGRKYVFLGEEGPGGVGSGLASGDIHVIDVSDMSAPRKVAQYAITRAGTHNFSMDEQSGILYAAYYNGGVRALDVRGNLDGCPAAQRNAGGYCDLGLMGREVGTALTDGGYVWGVAWQDDYVYASDMRKGLYKLDVSRLRR